ncbi:MAG: DMT family transporter, partial [Gluconacetobacter diazotrophicus]|nr:DMT family transporter [Gluconacetobacter diazotrophicus]
AGPVNGVTITANILCSLLIDHFGLFNMGQHSMNGWRALGAVLMVAGVTLIARF